MPDTRRTLSQIYALFADNTSQAISPQDLRDFVKTIEIHRSTAGPTANDDSANTSGNGIFTAGSEWAEVSADESVAIFYKCLDATAGDAIWVVSGIEDWGGLQEETAPAAGDRMLIRTTEGYRWIDPTTLQGSAGVASQLDADGTTLDVNAITDATFLQRTGTTVVGGKAVPTGVVVGSTDAQTLTNKILGAGTVINAVAYGREAITLDNATSETLDASTQAYKQLTFDGVISGTTLNVINWPTSGTYGQLDLEIVQDATGGRTIDFSGVGTEVIPLSGEFPDLVNAGPNEVTFVTLWTDDAGANVYLIHNKPSRINAQTGTAYTYVSTDAGKLVTADNSAAITHTIPTDANADFSKGEAVAGQQLGTGQVTITGDTGVTVNGVSGGSVVITNGQYVSTWLAVKHGPNVWTVSGAVA